MATDHFIKHKRQIGRIDWNFNFLFHTQPQVAQHAEQYTQALQHPGLHKPVPGKWLHATVLRVGFLEEYSETDMLAVADKLAPKLKELRLPKFRLGQWWLWGGNPCVHLTPDDALKEVHHLLLECLREVIEEKSWNPQWTYSFMPHITLAYSKNYDDELGLYKQLETHPVKSIALQIESISLIKQRIEDDHYVWDVIRQLDIGQAA